MAKEKYSKKEWEGLCSLLSKSCNRSGYEPTAVDVILKQKAGNPCIEVVPASTANPRTLHCTEEIVDLCRVYSLSFWVGISKKEDGTEIIVGHVF